MFRGLTAWCQGRELPAGSMELPLLVPVGTAANSPGCFLLVPSALHSLEALGCSCVGLLEEEGALPY